MGESNPLAPREERSKRLPAPFDDVHFEWDASESGIRLLYAGDPARLIECGAIEPDMGYKSKVKTKPRVDSAGYHYKRDLWVDTKKMTANVTICRYITDEAFAKTLPGTPRTLRFKMLDWLDANAEKAHVTQEERSEGTVETRTSFAGKIDTLMAVGFRQSLFKQRFCIHGMGLGLRYTGEVLEKHIDPDRIDLLFGYIYPLMRGYFEVVIRSKAKPPTSSVATKKPRAKTTLRLVVDNDAGSQHE